MTARSGLSPGLLARLFATAFLFDGAFYIVLTAIPLRAVQLDASAVELGLLPVLSSGVYIAAALAFGRLSDRLSAHRMAMLGAFLRTLVILALLQAETLGDLFWAMPALGIANGLFWPAVQGGLGRAVDSHRLSGAVGWFNMAWSSGKMMGFALGGVLSDQGGFALPLWVAMGATLVVVPLVPARLGARRSADIPSAPRPEPDVPDEVTTALPGSPRGGARRLTWRSVGWFANSVLFGVGATLNFQYPKLMDARGMSGTDFGTFLALIYLFQTVSFAALGRWTGWHHRLRPLVGAHLLALLCLLGLLVAHEPWMAWLLAPGIGWALGVSYSASLYYSLLDEAGTGRSSGYHEAVLGAGTLVMPVCAGLAVQGTGKLEAAYPFLGLVLLALAAAEFGLVWRDRSNTSRAGR